MTQRRKDYILSPRCFMWRKFTLNMKYLADSNIETARLLRLTNMIVTIQNNL